MQLRKKCLTAKGFWRIMIQKISRLTRRRDQSSLGGVPYMDLKGRNFLKLLDYTPEEIGALVDLAAELKAKKKQGIAHDTLRGKNIALIFEKTSTRTRCAFEVAGHDLGMGEIGRAHV